MHLIFPSLSFSLSYLLPPPPPPPIYPPPPFSISFLLPPSPYLPLSPPPPLLSTLLPSLLINPPAYSSSLIPFSLPSLGTHPFLSTLLPVVFLAFPTTIHMSATIEELCVLTFVSGEGSTASRRGVVCGGRGGKEPSHLTLQSCTHLCTCVPLP